METKKSFLPKVWKTVECKYEDFKYLASGSFGEVVEATAK